MLVVGEIRPFCHVIFTNGLHLVYLNINVETFTTYFDIFKSMAMASKHWKKKKEKEEEKEKEELVR